MAGVQWKSKPIARAREPTEPAPDGISGQESPDRIIHMLETGAAPWQETMESGPMASLDMPMNPTDWKGIPRRANAIHLMADRRLRG